MTRGGHAGPALGTVLADSYLQVKQRLREAVRQRGREGELRLPSEAELAGTLGVSRATVRSALLSLQKEGSIRRLHGHGTFVNRHAIGIGPNLAEATPFVDLLADAGHAAAVRTLDQGVVALDAPTAASLEVPEGADGLRIERLFTADGRPAVHSVDHVPAHLLGDAPERRHPRRSTFEFVEAHAGLPVCYSVAEVRPVLPGPEVAEALELAAGTPVLRLRHVHVRDDELPVALTIVHVNDEILRFSVVRTHLDQ